MTLNSPSNGLRLRKVKITGHSQALDTLTKSLIYARAYYFPGLDLEKNLQ